MKISGIFIEDKIKEKILNKHNVEADEIKQTIFSNTLVLKTKENRYMVIGHHQRYLTIIFEMYHGTAFIITAYLDLNEAQKYDLFLILGKMGKDKVISLITEKNHIYA
ncbi:MAG: hypothetical protein AABX29_08145 [Nanoarchaeota archaeon]